MDDKFYLPQFEDSPIQEIHESLELETPIWYDKVSPWKRLLNYCKLTRPKIFMGTYLISLLIVVTGLVHMLFNTSADKNKVVSVFTSVSNIMNNAPIKELFVAPEECDQNLETVNLGRLPGTLEGCYYAESNNLESGKCVDQKEGGKYIAETSGILFNTWKGYSFCASRFKEDQYYFDNSETCNDGYLKCGKFLCVKSTKCSISSLKIVEIPPEKTDLNKIIKISNTQYFVVDKQPTEEPIITFHIAIDGNPCLDLDSTPIDVDRYPLIDAPKGCGYGKDKEVRFVDKVNLVDAIKQTKEGYSHVEKLPLYSDYLNAHQAHLFGIPRLKLASDPICWQENIFAELDVMGEFVIEIENWGNVYFICAIFITLGITFLSIESRNSLTKDIETLDIGMKSREGRALGCLAFIFLILSVIFVISITPDFSKILDFKENVDTVLANRCFESHKVTEAISDFATLLRREVTPLYAFVIVESVILIIPCIIIVLERFKEKDTDNNRPLKKSYKYISSLILISSIVSH